MTAKRIETDGDRIDDLPVPPWVRPLSNEEQDALIQEAEDDIVRGNVFDEAEADRRIDAMLARYRR